MKEKIAIVNNKDEIISYKERGTLCESDLYRVSALWIENSKGDILLAQRSFSKKNSPGKWGPAVAGTVDEGETYFENIIKETEEEIGLKDIEFGEFGKKFNGRYFCMWYRAVLDINESDINFQKEEVERVRWFSRSELEKEFRFNPELFLKDMTLYLNWFK